MSSSRIPLVDHLLEEEAKVEIHAALFILVLKAPHAVAENVLTVFIGVFTLPVNHHSKATAKEWKVKLK